MEEISIAVLDDGINDRKDLLFDLETVDGKIVTRNNLNSEMISHGTICYHVIKKYYPNCRVGSIKVIEKKEESFNNLLIAIKWCTLHQIKMIHMSIGTCSLNAYFSLREILAEYVISGGVIVAANSNSGKFTLPAAYSFVFSVQCNEMIEEGRIVNVYSCKYDKCIFEIGSISEAGIDQKYYWPSCNSYTAPVLTSKFYSILKRKKYDKYYLLFKWLNVNEIECYRPDFIANAYVFGADSVAEKEKYFFEVKKYFYCEEEMEDDKGEKKFVLVALKKVSIKLLDKLKDKIFAVVYANIRNVELYNWCYENKKLLWDETLYVDKLQRKEKLFPIGEMNKKPFIIEVKYADTSFITHLNDGFRKKGYHLWAASDKKRAYLYGIDFIPSCFDINSFIDTLCRSLEMEVLILYLDNMMYNERDIEVIVGDNNRVENDTIIFNRQCIDNIDEVIKAIEKMSFDYK